MAATLVVRDETIAGKSFKEWSLEFLTEKITVRELIRSRVYQEVQDYNAKTDDVFRGLIQPEGTEKVLNGFKPKQKRVIDWKRQFEHALKAFKSNQILILVNTRQAEDLDEEIIISADTAVSFVKLVPLVGG